jgi:hypothetical protein
MEKLVHSKLMEHLSDNNILSDQQFGFRPQFSTGEALLSVTYDWFEALDNKHEVSTLFFDLTKAFDSIPHSVVLQKLKSAGLSPCLCAWFSSYLSNRYQQVIINGATSNRISVVSGVPQGSVLGPVIFLVAINDLTRLSFSSGTKFALYADDIVLYKIITSYFDLIHIQQDINRLSDWMSCNGLTLNGSKTKFMLLTRKLNSHVQTDHHFKLNNVQIERVFEFKYLGVLLAHDLSWSPHIKSICSKAKRLLGLFYRQFYKVDHTLILKCYMTMVRPILDYCCTVWAPHTAIDVKRLENVQYFALKMATRSWREHYEDLLVTCKIPSLSSRRSYFDCCLVYKIISDLSCIPPSHFSFSTRLNTRRNHSRALRTSRIPKTEATRGSFSFRAVPIWNSLPETAVGSISYSNFKIAFKRLHFA